MSDNPSILAESGLRTFDTIAKRWRLTTREREQILGLDRGTHARLRARPEPAVLDPTTIERLSHLFGIYRALQLLFRDEQQADTAVG